MTDTTTAPPWKQPAGLKLITDYIAPINTLVFFCIGIVDILTPKLGRTASLSLIGIATLLLAFIIFWELKAQRLTRAVGKRGLLLTGIVLLFGLGMFAAKAAMASDQSAASQVAPNLVAMIQKDLGIIKDQNQTVIAKVDQVQASVNEMRAEYGRMLKDFIAQITPQMEPAVAKAVPNYKKLTPQQRDAVTLVVYKIGPNNLKSHKALMNEINAYALNPTSDRERQIRDKIDFMVNLEGKQVQDKKTDLLIAAMLLDPDTFAYITGTGPMPADTSLIAYFGFDPTAPIDPQFDLAPTRQESGDIKYLPYSTDGGASAPFVADSQRQPPSKKSRHKSRHKCHGCFLGQMY